MIAFLQFKRIISNSSNLGHSCWANFLLIPWYFKLISDKLYKILVGTTHIPVWVFWIWQLSACTAFCELYFLNFFTHNCSSIPRTRQFLTRWIMTNNANGYWWFFLNFLKDLFCLENSPAYSRIYFFLQFFPKIRYI